MNTQKFKVFGDGSLLKECKINIIINKQLGFDNKKLKYQTSKEVKTLLYKGNVHTIESLEEDFDYTIYVSYQNKLVGTLKFENLFRNASDQVSHFYLDKKNDTVSIIFIGRESEIATHNGFKTVLIPLNDYFDLNRIKKEELKEEEKKLFFNFYEK